MCLVVMLVYLLIWEMGVLLLCLGIFVIMSYLLKINWYDKLEVQFMLFIIGIFLDEISYDIFYQNWGRREWDVDFVWMKKMGIDIVILICCGYK